VLVGHVFLCVRECKGDQSDYVHVHVWIDLIGLGLNSITLIFA
jgi:hypothetical protein